MTFYNTPTLSEDENYSRYIKMGIDEIPSVNPVGKIIQFDNGMHVNARSTRMRLFIEKHDLACHFCGIRVDFAAVEDNSCKNNNVYKKNAVKATPHLNFYGIDNNGKEVLMTWDHIQPRSLGGKNSLENAQCLCCHCNGFKGNSFDYESVKQRRIEKNMPTLYEYDGDKTIYHWS